MGSAQAAVLTILTRSRALPILVLVAANCTPIVGVVAFGWDVFPVLLLFWIENVTIGAVNVLKMMSAAPDDPVKWIGKLFLVPFFCIHYGIFCLVHGAFVITLFGGALGGGSMLPIVALLRFIEDNHLEWPIVSLVGSHLLSFGWNYIGHGEYRRASLNDLMSQPYSRVVVLHITVLFGGLAVVALHSPAGALVLLIAVKTLLDIWAHVKERQKFAQPGVGARAPAPATVG